MVALYQGNANIGLVQVDGALPNIALMKIAAHYEKKGASVDWWLGGLFDYDKVYASKIFKFSYEGPLPAKTIRGGTGYDIKAKLPDEIDSLDHAGGWFLYPKYFNHIGFSQRGCRLRCSFCVVPSKEGLPRVDSSIKGLLSNPRGQDRLVLLDDDFLGHPENEDVFLELIDRKLKVCFCQGLNIRLITERQAELLAQVKFYNPSFNNRLITFAWDNVKDERAILKGYFRCIEAGVMPYQMQFFVLIGYDSTPEEDMHRIERICDLGALPFVMPYNKKNEYQKNLARWVNNRAVFRSTPFENYKYNKESA